MRRDVLSLFSAAGRSGWSLRLRETGCVKSVLCSWEEWMEPQASGNRKSAVIIWPTAEGK